MDGSSSGDGFRKAGYLVCTAMGGLLLMQLVYQKINPQAPNVVAALYEIWRNSPTTPAPGS